MKTAKGALGASLGPDGCEFLVWAPFAERVHLEIGGRPDTPMTAERDGYHRTYVAGISAGARYCFNVNGKSRPDPASRFQPDGVHEASAVVDPSFEWTDGDWINPPLADYIFYEIHPGTFSAEGTLDGIAPRLGELRELGVTAIEIMPVAQFPGSRNWGYDGVFPFAAQNSYGGPAALKRLVNEAHRTGLAVVLDVVYNHVGPEGNYLYEFGPYFTDRYHTPWGEALNFDGADSDEVRRYFIENALYWISECHVDALRLDAIHAIVDTSARPFLQELTETIGGRAYVIAESDLNDVRVLRPAGSGGLGCDAQWSDSFHHLLHVMLTGEHGGYYQDFGTVDQLAAAYTEAFVYSGQYSQFRRRRYGNCARGLPGEQFVVCAQNHDQIGNRAHGERLSALVDFESLKLAAGATLLAPNLPLLFMGEEYGETAPFLYFTSHSDPVLVEAVRRGRQEEFAAFSWKGEIPDPHEEDTFQRSRLSPRESWSANQELLREFYRELIRIRRTIPALSNLSMDRCQAIPVTDRILRVRRWSETSEITLLLNFSHEPTEVGIPSGHWSKLLSSSDERWNGAHEAPAELTGLKEYHLMLQPRSFALYELR